MKIRNTIPFTVASKKMKYISPHVTKQGQDVCAEHEKLLMRGLEEDQGNGGTCAGRETERSKDASSPKNGREL